MKGLSFQKVLVTGLIAIGAIAIGMRMGPTVRNFISAPNAG